MAMITMIKKRDGRQVPFNIELFRKGVFPCRKSLHFPMMEAVTTR